MTVLQTDTGQLLRTAGPYQLTPAGYPSLPRSSRPFDEAWSSGSLSLVGPGQTVSFSQIFRDQLWVATAINKLTRLISTLPLKVYAKDPETGDRARARTSPLAELLDKPYPRCGPVHFKQNLAFPMLLHGNALVVKFRDEPGGPPTSLLPLDWRFVTPVALQRGGPVEFWRTTQTGDTVYIPADDTIHLAWRSPEGEVGVSPLQQLGVTVRLEDAAQRYSTSSFDNAVRPSGAVVIPADAKTTKVERDEYRREIQAMYGGVDQAFKVAVLGGGMDWKPMSFSAVEAALIEQRKLNREEVAAIYDIPPPLIGILDHATYSNVQEMGRLLYKQVLLPWLTLIEETLQAQLIDSEPAFDGMHVEFDMDEQLKGDPLDRSRAAALWITHGVYTINEVRQLENLPRIDNPVCDQPLIPVNNMAPATSLNPQQEQPLPGDMEPQPGDLPGDPLVPGLSSHLQRVEHRVLTRLGSKHPKPWDRDRFLREFTRDMPDQPAEKWADAIEIGLAYSDGDAVKAREFFKCLAPAPAGAPGNP